MPAAFSAGRSPYSGPAQSPPIRFSSQNVADSRSGLFGAAKLNIAFDAAGSFVNARVSSARARSAADNVEDFARVVRSATAAGTCSRQAMRVNVGDHARGSVVPSTGFNFA